MTVSFRNLISFAKRLNRDEIFSFFYPATLYCCLCVLAFNVSTIFDKVLAGGMIISFLTVLITNLRHKKQDMQTVLKQIFFSGRLFYVAFFLYLIWDLILLFYAKDLFLAVKKLPYYLEYLFLFWAGVWYCSDRKRLLYLMISIAVAGSSVAVFSYFYHFFGRKPYYFQRMSTCRDYNVYATLLFVSLVFAIVLIMNILRVQYWKRLLFLTGVLVVNLPAFYLAGSRRMLILLPYFFAFALLYEILCNVRNLKKLLQSVVMLLLCGLMYGGVTLLAEPFAAYGEAKRNAYNVWVLSQEEQMETSDLESTETPASKPSGSLAEAPKESTLFDVIETIEDGSMSGKRELIYASGFEELMGYSPLEWVIGRGASYDLYYYTVTEDETLLNAYGYTLENRPLAGWMSAHNFLLADVLNGGVVKLLLGLFLVIMLLVETGRACRKSPELGVLLVIPVALTICNACISGAYGLVSDVFFMMMLAIVGGVLRQEKVKKRKSFQK